MSNPAFKFDHVHIIARDPHATARWYVEMLGATISADTVARGACRIRPCPLRCDFLFGCHFWPP